MLRKRIWCVIGAFALFATFMFNGCSSETEGEYAALLAENEELTANYEALLRKQENLLSENMALLAENEALQNQGQTTEQAAIEETSGAFDAQLYAGGEFVATVWGFVPEYVNIPDNQIAVVLSEFQSELFLAYIDREMSEQLEIEETYVFEAPEVFVAYLSVAEAHALYENESVSATALSGDTTLYIESFREPGENEGGLASSELSYTILE